MDDLSNFFNPPAKTQLRKSEQVILSLVIQGLSNQAIAKQLFLSEKTVEHHMHNIYNKLEQMGVDFQKRSRRTYLVYLYFNNNSINSHKPSCLENMDDRTII